MNLITDFDSLEGSDIRRLAMIVLSTVAIVSAGFLSRSGLQRLSEIHEDDLRTPPVLTRTQTQSSSSVEMTKDNGSSVPSHAQRELRFAQTEIHRYASLVKSLKSRAETELSPVNEARMKTEVANLQDRLKDAELAAAALKASPATTRPAFLREDLHGSLLALQEAGKRAVSIFIDADNGFNPHDANIAYGGN